MSSEIEEVDAASVENEEADNTSVENEEADNTSVENEEADKTSAEIEEARAKVIRSIILFKRMLAMYRTKAIEMQAENMELLKGLSDRLNKAHSRLSSVNEGIDQVYSRPPFYNRLEFLATRKVAPTKVRDCVLESLDKMDRLVENIRKDVVVSKVFDTKKELQEIEGKFMKIRISLLCKRFEDEFVVTLDNLERWGKKADWCSAYVVVAVNRLVTMLREIEDCPPEIKARVDWFIDQLNILHDVLVGGRLIFRFLVPLIRIGLELWGSMRS